MSGTAETNVRNATRRWLALQTRSTTRWFPRSIVRGPVGRDARGEHRRARGTCIPVLRSKRGTRPSEPFVVPTGRLDTMPAPTHAVRVADVGRREAYRYRKQRPHP